MEEVPNSAEAAAIGQAPMSKSATFETRTREPEAEPKASAAPVAAAPVAPPVPRSDLNEMKGKLLARSLDPLSFRITVEGGYNVEFAYDHKTAVVNGGSPITIDNLAYGDDLIVRYKGKELYAIEIDRTGKAPRPLL